jgi:hypothetical protein
MKLYLKWDAKKKIVDEAYSTGNTIRGTARKHGVEPTQIRRWKRAYEDIVNKCGTDTDKLKHVMSLKCSHMEHPRKTDDATYELLYVFCMDLQRSQLPITLKKLSIEYRRLTDTSTDVRDEVIEKRIYRWLKTKNIDRRVTKVAQNTCYDQENNTPICEIPE